MASSVQACVFLVIAALSTVNGLLQALQAAGANSFPTLAPSYQNNGYFPSSNLMYQNQGGMAGYYSPYGYQYPTLNTGGLSLSGSSLGNSPFSQLYGKTGGVSNSIMKTVRPALPQYSMPIYQSVYSPPSGSGYAGYPMSGYSYGSATASPSVNSYGYYVPSYSQGYSSCSNPCGSAGFQPNYYPTMSPSSQVIYQAGNKLSDEVLLRNGMEQMEPQNKEPVAEHAKAEQKPEPEPAKS